MTALLSMVGNVGRVGELKEVNDTVVIEFGVASNNRVSGKTTWVTCAAWGNLAEKVVAPWVITGGKIFVSGSLEPVRAYQGPKGPGAEIRMRVSTIELLGSGRPDPEPYGTPTQAADDPYGTPATPEPYGAPQQPYGAPQQPPEAPADDAPHGDVPF